MSDPAIWYCPQCARKFKLPEGKAAPDLCPDCAQTFTLKRRVTSEEASPTERSAREREQREHAIAIEAEHLLLTTAPSLDSHRIVQTIEIVTAECVYGVNAWKELIASLTDFFGGRSGKMQQVLRDLRVTCLAELRKEAATVGANAVIGVNLAYSEIGVGKGLSMLMLVASGTAVRIEPRESE
jgi:uncharacterized protein YbjQ (UPF0145 family)